MRWLPLIVLLSSCTCASSHETDAGDASVPDTMAPPPDTMVVPDIGPPDGPVVTDCLSGFDAVDGQACDFDGRCHAIDLCCSAESSCFDGRLRLFNSGLDECLGVSATTDCTSPEGAGVAVGMTPAGPIDLPYVHASFSFAFAVDVILMFTANSALSTCGAPRLSVFFGPHADPAFSYVGTHDVVAQLVTSEGVYRALGTVEITDGDTEAPGPGHLEGSLRVEGTGWDVRADFVVDGCDDVDRSGP